MISAISSKGSTSSGLPWFVGPPTRSLHCRFAGTHSISFVNIHRMIYLVSVALLRNLHSVPKRLVVDWHQRVQRQPVQQSTRGWWRLFVLNMVWRRRSNLVHSARFPQLSVIFGGAWLRTKPLRCFGQIIARYRLIPVYLIRSPVAAI